MYKICFVFIVSVNHICSSFAKIGRLLFQNQISTPASVSLLESDWINITYKAYNLHNKY